VICWKFPIIFTLSSVIQSAELCKKYI